MRLMRVALKDFGEHLIPLVYDWNPSSPTGGGWLMQEFKIGTQLDKVFEDLDSQEKDAVLRYKSDSLILIDKAAMNAIGQFTRMQNDLETCVLPILRFSSSFAA